MKNTTVLLLLFVCTIFACKSDKQGTAGTASKSDSVIINRIFKNIDFNSTKRNIQSQAEGKKIKETADMLLYSTDISDEDFEDIAYSFENDKLNKIEYTAYLGASSTASALNQKLKSEFDENYTKVGKLWDGKIKNTPFTVFLKKTTINKKNAVIVIFEKL